MSANQHRLAVAASISTATLKEVKFEGPGDGPDYLLERAEGSSSALKVKMELQDRLPILIGGFRTENDKELRSNSLIIAKASLSIQGSRSQPQWKSIIR